MTYLRGALSGVAAIVLALILPGLVYTLRSISQSKATGIAATAGGLVGALFSPLFWILAAAFFAFFFWAGGRSNLALRVMLFWVPAVLTCLLGFGITALIAYSFLRSRSG